MLIFSDFYLVNINLHVNFAPKCITLLKGICMPYGNGNFFLICFSRLVFK